MSKATEKYRTLAELYRSFETPCEGSRRCAERMDVLLEGMSAEEREELHPGLEAWIAGLTDYEERGAHE